LARAARVASVISGASKSRPRSAQCARSASTTAGLTGTARAIHMGHAVAYVAQVEFMQVRIRPAHRRLDDL
jgi:hypothetical protein